MVVLTVPTQFATIQSAIAAAQAGDTIQVQQNISLASEVNDGGKDNITVEGITREITIRVLGAINGFHVRENRSGWIFQNFTIVGDKALTEKAHFRFSGSKNCIVQNVTSRNANGYGLRCETWGDGYQSTLPVADNIQIIDCDFEDAGHNSVEFAPAQNSLVRGCRMVKTTYGVDEENLWIGNAYDRTPSENNLIDDCDIIGGLTCVLFDVYGASTPVSIRNNVIRNSRITMTAPTDWAVVNILGQNNTIEGCDIRDLLRTNGMIIYVGTNANGNQILNNPNIQGNYGVRCPVSGAVTGVVIDSNRFRTGSVAVFFPAPSVGNTITNNRALGQFNIGAGNIASGNVSFIPDSEDGLPVTAEVRIDADQKIYWRVNTVWHLTSGSALPQYGATWQLVGNTLTLQIVGTDYHWWSAVIDITTEAVTWTQGAHSPYYPPEAYTVTINLPVNGATTPAGIVTQQPQQSQVSITATPDQRYVLYYWELDGVNVGSTNPLIVVFDKDHTLSVYFKLEVIHAGCFIATACGVSNPCLADLRTFRDRYLPEPVTETYYAVSPPLAEELRKHEHVKYVVRRLFEWLTYQLKRIFRL